LELKIRRDVAPGADDIPDRPMEAEKPRLKDDGEAAAHERASATLTKRKYNWRPIAPFWNSRRGALPPRSGGAVG
jgi:hypothetical protein